MKFPRGRLLLIPFGLLIFLFWINLIRTLLLEARVNPPFKYDLFVTLAYIVGFFLQLSYILLSSRQLNLKKSLGIIGIAVGIFFIGMLPGRSEENYNPFVHVLFATVISGISISAFAKKVFAPRINEFSFLMWSLILPYILWERNLPIWLIMISFIPLICTIVNTFTDFDKHRPSRISLYLLFLAMIITANIIHIQSGQIKFFLETTESYIYTPIDFLFLGMLIAYTAPYIGYFTQIFRGKHEDKETYKKRRARLFDLLSDNFDHKQNYPSLYVAIMIGITVLLVLNHYYHYLSIPTIIISVSILSQFAVARFSKKQLNII